MACGVVFKLNKKNTEIVVRRFTGGAGGAHPSFGSLIMDPAGNLYGTTDSGDPRVAQIMPVASSSSWTSLTMRPCSTSLAVFNGTYGYGPDGV
jgi:hypothetical protein